MGEKILVVEDDFEAQLMLTVLLFDRKGPLAKVREFLARYDERDPDDGIEEFVQANGGTLTPKRLNVLREDLNQLLLHGVKVPNIDERQIDVFSSLSEAISAFTSAPKTYLMVVADHAMGFNPEKMPEEQRGKVENGITFLHEVIQICQEQEIPVPWLLFESAYLGQGIQDQDQDPGQSPKLQNPLENIPNSRVAKLLAQMPRTVQTGAESTTHRNLASILNVPQATLEKVMEWATLIGKVDWSNTLVPAIIHSIALNVVSQNKSGQ